MPTKSSKKYYSVYRINDLLFTYSHDTYDKSCKARRSRIAYYLIEINYGSFTLTISFYKKKGEDTLWNKIKIYYLEYSIDCLIV